MKLTPEEASNLTGPQVLEFIVAQCAAEREACAAIADATAERETDRCREVAHSIAAQIRARAGER